MGGKGLDHHHLVTMSVRTAHTSVFQRKTRWALSLSPFGSIWLRVFCGVEMRRWNWNKRKSRKQQHLMTSAWFKLFWNRKLEAGIINERPDAQVNKCKVQSLLVYTFILRIKNMRIEFLRISFWPCAWLIPGLLSYSGSFVYTGASFGFWIKSKIPSF